MNSERVLAIDPGYERLGAAILSGGRGTERLEYSTCITTSADDAFPVRLGAIDRAVEAVIQEYKPDVLAVETIAFGVNVKTALPVAAARGVVIARAVRAGLAVYEYTPQDVKIALTGHGAAGKRAVTDMVCRLVSNPPEDALDDEYDAIAIGLTHIARGTRRV